MKDDKGAPDPERAESGDDRPESDHAGDEGFLQRWSRRKHEAGRGPELAPASMSEEPEPDHDTAPPEPGDAAASAEVDTAQGEPEPPGDEDMPPLESIDQGGSVSDFLSPKVSAGLRRAALRRLFSQPEFNMPELLEEYAHDYSNPTPLGDVVTVEMRYRAEQALKLAERKLKAAMEAAAESDSRPALAQTAETGSEATELSVPEPSGLAESEIESADGDAASDEASAAAQNPPSKPNES